MPATIAGTRAEEYIVCLVRARLADRYTSWVDANRVGILLTSVVVAGIALWLSLGLTVQSSLSNLLPSSQRSVRDLHVLQERARPFGSVQIVVESHDSGLRKSAADAIADRLRRLPPDLVLQVQMDDGPLHRYIWNHRFMLAELEDLIAARDALHARIDDAKIRANPLYIALDDEDAPMTSRLDELERKLAEIETKAKAPAPRVSRDGRMQLVIVQTPFGATSSREARALMGHVNNAVDVVRREVGPAVSFGITGNVTNGLREHDSVLDGMMLAVCITVVVCGIGLVLYYRSGRVVLAMMWALVVGTLACFALTQVMIGHLNVMTAFLAAIVLGNGVNASLVLVARYQEEVDHGTDPRAAMSAAIAGALRGTLAAAATAAVAYTSLMITDFRGFRQFGAIAGMGIALTWMATFIVVPALLLLFVDRGWIKRARPSRLGDVLEGLLPRRLSSVVVAGLVVTAVGSVITADYVASNPFTRDWRDLQSSTPEIRSARALDARIGAAFDTKALLSAQAYLVVIAVDRRDQVPPLVAKLRADDAARAEHDRWVKDVRSIDDLLPRDQDKKLAVLAEIRALLDDPDLQATLDDAERARLAKVRPPDSLRPLADADLPEELAWPFIERDGTRGRLVVIRGSSRFNAFDVDDRLRFAAEVQRIDVPSGAVVASESLIVADIIRTMERDTPKMVAFALLGSMLAVWLMVGRRRHGLVTLGAGLAGVTLMIAVSSLVGLKVHFLDLIALPITIGIGIDYAVNLAARDRQDGHRGPHYLIRTTGAAVLLCSFTTTVGYSTLLLSPNGGIRAFGIAALIGEITCILMALMFVPAVLHMLRQRDRRA